MSGPYLMSGESIVLTTDRVSLDRGIWEAMLTTRQLILTDSENARSAPRVIPLAGVSSVRSGKAATGEPVIILTHQQPDEDAPETSILTFMQEPLESRKHDRDNWVKKLIELSVSSRAEHVSIETAPAGSGMRPSVRRWVAPDIARPRPENFPAPEPPREMEIILDEPEPVVIPQIYPAMKEPVEPQEQPEDIPGPESGERGWNGQEQASIETHAPEQPVNRESPGAKIHIPPESLSASILAAVRSLTGDQPARIPPVATGDEVPPKEVDHLCDTPIRRTSSLPEEVNESPVTMPPEQPVILPSPALEDHLPVFEEIERGVMRSSQITETLPEPVGDGGVISAPVEGIPEEREPEVQVVTPDRIEDEAEVESPGKEAVPVASGGSNEPEAPLVPAHKKPEDPPAGRPGILPIIAGATAVCILLLIAAILFMPPSGIPLMEHQPVTPTTVPVTPLTPAPALIPPVVPQEGTWVRITSPAYYSGEAGNPGYLQQFSGSGEKRIRMLRDDGLVQVSVEKQDYTIDLLLVEIYVNGTLVTTRSTTAPGGSVVLLIDPATGNPPGILSDVTTNTTNTGQLSYY